MAKNFCSISVSETVDIDIDLELSEIVEGLSKEAAQELRILLGPASVSPVADASRVIESAYLKAKQMADCPQEFKDLLWIVHDRALP